MKAVSLGIRILGILSVGCCAHAAPFLMEWQRSFGGSRNDVLTCVHKTLDGGYIAGGYSDSVPGGNKGATNWGRFDYWIVRVNANGEKLWDRSYGGTENDYLTDIIVLPGGGFLLAGNSASSTNECITGPVFGSFDCWIVRIDSQGEQLWDRTFGGYSGEGLDAIIRTSDRGYLVGSTSSSPPGGNKTSTNYAGTGVLDAGDIWLIKMDENGRILWDQTYGGTNRESRCRLRELANGGFIVSASSQSPPSGNKTAPVYGNLDYWLVRLDADGQMLWDRSYGGSAGDRSCGALELPDAGFLIGGHSSSPADGTKTAPNLYDDDFWLVRTDTNGTPVWDKAYGTEGRNVSHMMGAHADGSAFILGTGGPSAADMAILQMSEAGIHMWTGIYGGTNEEGPILETTPNTVFEFTSDGGFIAGCPSLSGISGNKVTDNFGSIDYWIIKVSTNLQPSLMLNPSHFTTYVAPSQAATNRAFTIANAGTGIFPYKVETDAAWLSVSLTNGILTSAPSTNALFFKPQGQLGTYTASARVISTDLASVMGTITVTLVVTNGPLPIAPALWIGPRPAIDPQNSFLFYLGGAADTDYSVEQSSNLIDWTPSMSIRLPGPECVLTNVIVPNAARFYRARLGK